MKRPDWLKLSSTVVFGLVAVGVLGLGWVVVYLPQLQTASLRQGVEDYRSLPKPDPEKLATLEKGQIDSENAIRTGLFQGIGGTVLLVGLYFTYQNLRTAEANLEATQRNVLIAAEKQATERQTAEANLKLAEAKQATERKTAEANLKLAEAKQVTDRFSTAVGMLSHASLHTRLGGIYALERIARDSDDDYWQVMEVLTAFVREESPWPPKPKKTESDSATAEAQGSDLVTVPQPLAEGSVAVIEASQTLRTHIQAVMTVIGRRKYRYKESETQRLDLRRTDLRKLQAREANLTGLLLSDSCLAGAELYGAHLEGVDLSRTNLEGAYLETAHLERAVLIKASLCGALLQGAKLSKAVMLATCLEEADLEGVDLSEVDRLTQSQINLAITDKSTTFPPGLYFPQVQLSQAPPQAPIASPSPATPEPNAEPQPPAT